MRLVAVFSPGAWAIKPGCPGSAACFQRSSSALRASTEPVGAAERDMKQYLALQAFSVVMLPLTMAVYFTLPETRHLKWYSFKRFWKPLILGIAWIIPFSYMMLNDPSPD